MMIGKKQNFTDNKEQKPEREITKVSVIFFHDAKVLLTV